MSVHPKKSLGQNFLRSQRIASHIADSARLTKDDIALEVGPGTGILTRELIARAGRVIAIEKDRRLITPLQAQFAKEIQEKRLQLVEADALDFNPKTYNLEPHTYTVVANIPYYITGELIERLLTSNAQPKRVVLLVQKEVAERVARERKGSVLSMSVRAYGEPRYVKTVSASHFSPKPKVGSAILLIDNISRDRFKEVSEEHFFSILKTGFAHKRKKLLGNLTDRFGKESASDVFHALGLPENTRAEELSIDKWFSLAKQLD